MIKVKKQINSFINYITCNNSPRILKSKIKTLISGRNPAALTRTSIADASKTKFKNVGKKTNRTTKNDLN